jgi:hypothetical protein
MMDGVERREMEGEDLEHEVQTRLDGGNIFPLNVSVPRQRAVQAGSEFVWESSSAGINRTSGGVE